MVDVIESLRWHFGHASLRSGQENIVRAMLEGRDVRAVMPTGSGKSLAFQLPALLLQSTTLVASPLIALMKNQVDELTGAASAPPPFTRWPRPTRGAPPSTLPPFCEQRVCLR
jgi:superfamily II DNA helicase RecQ